MIGLLLDFVLFWFLFDSVLRLGYRLLDGGSVPSFGLLVLLLLFFSPSSLHLLTSPPTPAPAPPPLPPPSPLPIPTPSPPLRPSPLLPPLPGHEYMYICMSIVIATVLPDNFKGGGGGGLFSDPPPRSAGPPHPPAAHGFGGGGGKGGTSNDRPLSKAAEAVIKRSLLVGNFEAAVQCCMSTGNMADAMLLARCVWGVGALCHTEGVVGFGRCWVDVGGCGRGVLGGC